MGRRGGRTGPARGSRGPAGAGAGEAEGVLRRRAGGGRPNRGQADRGEHLWAGGADPGAGRASADGRASIWGGPDPGPGGTAKGGVIGPIGRSGLSVCGSAGTPMTASGPVTLSNPRGAVRIVEARQTAYFAAPGRSSAGRADYHPGECCLAQEKMRVYQLAK